MCIVFVDEVFFYFLFAEGNLLIWYKLPFMKAFFRGEEGQLFPVGLISSSFSLTGFSLRAFQVKSSQVEAVSPSRLDATLAVPSLYDPNPFLCTTRGVASMLRLLPSSERVCFFRAEETPYSERENLLLPSGRNTLFRAREPASSERKRHLIPSEWRPFNKAGGYAPLNKL